MSTERPISLDELIEIASTQLGDPVEHVAREIKVGPAASALAAPFAGVGDQDRYPDIAMKASVLTSRIAKNHPFRDGNKRAALLAGLLFLRLNGFDVSGVESDQQLLHDLVRRLAGEPPPLSEEAFAEFLASRIEPAED